MANPLQAIGGFFAKVFRWFAIDAAQRVAEKVRQYCMAALPVVEFIASMTPTRIDDEIIALCKKFGLSNLDKYLALPQEERGEALMAAAISELQKRFPYAPISQLRAAIEFAVVISKAK